MILNEWLALIIPILGVLYMYFFIERPRRRAP